MKTLVFPGENIPSDKRSEFTGYSWIFRVETVALRDPETAIVEFEKALQNRETADRRFHAAAAYTQLKR